MDMEQTQRQLRKTKSNLVSLGRAVMLFGGWALLRYLITNVLLVSQTDVLGNEMKEAGWLAGLPALLLTLGLHVLVGLGAIRDGLGQKHIHYHAGAVLLLAESIISVLFFSLFTILLGSGVLDLGLALWDWVDLLLRVAATLIVEISLLVLLIDLLHLLSKRKKLIVALGEEE